MLTKEQIEAARKTLSLIQVGLEDDAEDTRLRAGESHDAQDRDDLFICAAEDQGQADEVGMALIALAAYERVVSLLATLESTPCDPRLDADAVREQIIAALRRAVEG